jgi:hypothetical protein
MAVSMVRGALVGATSFLATAVWAADPPPADTLPPPRPVAPSVVVVPAPPVYRLYTPPLSREVWQIYDVDYRGSWRPRVIRSPYGDYYLYNHAPYPWAAFHPEWFKGRVVSP